MPIRTSVADRIAEILLDHPPVNAFDSAGWAELARTIAATGSRDDVSVVLLAAEGRGFCAGVDIKELARDATLITKVNKGCYDSFAAIHDCPVPVIAAAHGFVLGGGIGLVGSCDVILASEDATFGLPEIDRGALGAASHLLRMFPIQKVRKMLYTGEPISAAEAYRLGALEAVLPRAELHPAARALAAKIAAKSPKALRLAKESLNGIELLDIKRSYRFEQGFTLELYNSPDSQEARDAFVGKRDATFKDVGK
ncbi:MAG: enoyl-CoA hydratase [Polyangiaceae bacterium UTPRO1]|nr:enoyl-CoA hydratase family protein [Myxococcales bacterium]OQY66180.1 MAG: enoyl-CoA hydratase [Polyangiaceae bacterium UTPRO1]